MPDQPLAAGVRAVYADALANATVQSPKDFAQRWQDATGEDLEAGGALQQLPPKEHLIDAGIALSTSGYGQVSAPSAALVRQNLTDHYAASGEGPQDALRRAAGDADFHAEIALPPRLPDPLLATLNIYGESALHGTAAPEGKLPDEGTPGRTLLDSKTGSALKDAIGAADVLPLGDIPVVRAVYDTIGQVSEGIWHMVEGLSPQHYLEAENMLLSGQMTRSEMTGFLLQHAVSAAPGGSLSAGFRIGRFAYTDEQMSGMLDHAIKSSLLPKGSRIEDLQEFLRQLHEERDARVSASRDVVASRHMPDQPEDLEPGGGGGAQLPPPPARGALPGPEPSEPIIPPHQPEGQPGYGQYPRFRPAPEGESPETAAYRRHYMRETADALARVAGETQDRMYDFLMQLPGVPQLKGEQATRIEHYLEWPIIINREAGAEIEALSKARAEGTEEQIATAKQAVDAKMAELNPRQPAITAEDKDIIDTIIKPSQQRAAKHLALLREGRVLSDDEASQMSEGYLHRRLYNYMSDQQANVGGVTDPFSGMNSLRVKTSSMKTRQLADQTMSEIEASTDLRYVHEPVLNTLHNEMQLENAVRHYKLLTEDLGPQLVDAGLAAKDWQASRTLGFEPTTIPALNGWFFEPRIANTFNDFQRSPRFAGELGEQVGRVLDPVNRAIVNTMFLNPLPHDWNMFNDWILSRGAEWFRPSGYRSLVTNGLKAISDVWNKSDMYRAALREGASLESIPAETRNLHSLMLERFGREVETDPRWDGIVGMLNTGTAKLFDGRRGLASRIYDGIQQYGMWGIHDALLMQRIRELTGRGYALRDAIEQAHRHIASYRVPAEVMGSRWVSQLMQDPRFSMFGRYHYAKMRSLAEIGKDMIRGTGAQRADGLAKLLVLGAFTTAGSAGLNYLARSIFGDDNAQVRLGGSMGLVGNAETIGNDVLFKRDYGDAAFRFFSGLSGVISASPALEEVTRQVFNRDWSGGDIVDRDLPATAQAKQRAVHAFRQVEFAREAMDLAGHKPGAVVNALGLGIVRAPQPHHQYVTPRWKMRSEWRRYHRQMRQSGLE